MPDFTARITVLQGKLAKIAGHADKNGLRESQDFKTILFELATFQRAADSHDSSYGLLNAGMKLAVQTQLQKLEHLVDQYMADHTIT